jgi:hypothetical protein
MSSAGSSVRSAWRWRPRTSPVLHRAVALGLAALSPFRAVPTSPLPDLDNPFAVLDLRVATSLRDAFGIGTLVLLIAASASVVVRLLGPNDETRQQVKWFAFAAVLACLGVIGMFALGDAAGIVTIVLNKGGRGVMAARRSTRTRYRMHEETFGPAGVS